MQFISTTKKIRKGKKKGVWGLKNWTGLLGGFFFCCLMLTSVVVFAAGGWVADRETGCEFWVASDAGVASYFRGASSEEKRSFTWSGACNNNKLDGQGVMKIFEGGLMSTYEGAFVKGHQTGKGVLIWHPGKSYQENYTGDFVDGARHGQGTQVWQTGISYEGEWKDDLRHGKGITKWPDGKIEQGQYRNNVFVGP